MQTGRLGMDAAEMLKRVDENTICVVPTFSLPAGPILCPGDPASGIPAVTWRIQEGAQLPCTRFDLAEIAVIIKTAMRSIRCRWNPSAG